MVRFFLPSTGLHLLLPVVLAALSTSTQATLGEKADGVSSESIRLSAILTTSAQSLYTDNTLLQASGLTIHEYSRADGTIFAVAWTGPVMPDLQQLLGTYFTQFVSAREQAGPQGGLSRFHSTSDRLVIRSSGRLGAFSGLVYDPALVPDGVTPEQLQ